MSTKNKALADAVLLGIIKSPKRFDVVRLIGTDEYFTVIEKSKDNDKRYELIATPLTALTK